MNKLTGYWILRLLAATALSVSIGGEPDTQAISTNAVFHSVCRLALD